MKGLAAAALTRVGYRSAGGVMVITKFFLTVAWDCAAVSVGEDMAAFVLLVLRFWCRARVPPTGAFFARSSKEKSQPRVVRPGPLFSRLSAKARLLAGLFFIYFLFNELSKTRMPLFTNLFFGCRSLNRSLLFDLTCEFGGFLGKIPGPTIGSTRTKVQ